MSEGKDILHGGESGALSEEQMLAYFDGKLSLAEARVIEEILSNEGAESDALEGLQVLGRNDALALKGRLDATLQQMLHKKGRRPRRGIAQQRWTLLAIGIILILAIVCFAMMWVIKTPVMHK